MDARHLTTLRDEIFSRVRSILYERYGEFIPASLLEHEPVNEGALKMIRRAESFKADEDLLELFEALEKVFCGHYGICLFCRNEIDFTKLNSNPLAKFCDDCEHTLSPRYSKGKVELEQQ